MAAIPLLLETIRLQDGQLPHLAFHQARFDHTQQCLLGKSNGIVLAESIVIPESAKTGRYKVRVLYREKIELIEIQPYAIRPVAALQLVDAGELEYSFKFADRDALNALSAQRTYGDDVLLIRDDLLTDTSYANVALFDGRHWYTPAQPLLPGTARAKLLQEKRLIPADIYWRDLPAFRELRLINAMMDWEEGPTIPIERIKH